MGSFRHAFYGLGLTRGQYNLGAELYYVFFLSQALFVCLFLWYSSRYDLFPRNAPFTAPNYDSCLASVPSEETSPWVWTYPPPLALGFPRHALYGLGLSRGQYNLGAELYYVFFLSQALSVCVFYFVFIPL